MQKVEILKIFKTNLIKFFDALLEQIPNEPDLIILRMGCDQVAIDTVLDMFAQRIIPYKDMVLYRDERFFMECTDIFSGMQKDKVSYFKNLWSSPQFNSEDKDEIWRWFKLFLQLALKWEAMKM